MPLHSRRRLSEPPTPPRLLPSPSPAPVGSGWRAQCPADPPTGSRRRIALYSHDTQGLGHIRRNIALAAALVAHAPATDVLLLTGAPEATALPLPPHTDVVTLPTLRKDSAGRYSARTLGTGLPDLLAIRAEILRAALLSFSPDLLVVDKVARGVDGELDGALRALRCAGRTRVVLGLREVLDEPSAACRDWAAARTTEAVAEYYDAVWVYGDPVVYDPVAEYGLPPAVAAKVVHTGYLAHGRGEGVLAPARPAAATAPVPAADPFVLCLLGGGQDGAALARAFVAAPLPAGHRGLLLTGPCMRRESRAALEDAAAARPDLDVLEFVPDAEAWVRRAAAVVAMAGYNTVCELLAADARALLVPRTTPRREQAVRAERLSRLGLVDWLDPEAATPERLGDWLATAVSTAPARRRHPVDLDGLSVVPRLADALLGEPALATPDREVLHVAH